MTNEETVLILNDMLDAIEWLKDIVEELNPGATNQIHQINMVIDRSSRLLNQTAD